MKVSVIIPTHNRCSDLKDCIESLLSSSVKPYEIIVVDSCSTDGTEKLGDVYPIKYISIKQKNRQIARNVGISLARGDILAFLDDDVIVDRQWLKYLLEAYNHHYIGGVGGRVLPYGGQREYYPRIKHSDVGKVRKDGLVLGNFDTLLPEPIEVDTLQGCNMSFKKDVLKKVGGFDKELKGNCFRDDTDICLRVKKLGYKLIYQPKALVFHKYRGRKVIDAKQAYWYVRNNTYFYFKNIFPSAKLYLPLFLFRQFFPPQDYVKKAGIKIKLSMTLLIASLKGLVDGILTLRYKSVTDNDSVP